jgi:glutathione S-transferase
MSPVDLIAGVEDDTEFLAINPGGFIPAIQDGEVVMVEAIAIMEYLMARYGPTPLAPAFPAYQQFLHLGEAGLAASIDFVVGARNFAPGAARHNWSAGRALEVFESRLRLVTRQLARSPYLAGEAFTAADISVTYVLELAQRAGGCHTGRRGTGLSHPHQRTARLRAGHGHLPGHQGLGRGLGTIMTCRSAPASLAADVAWRDLAQRSSFRPTTMWCTSSGPSANRRWRTSV